MHFDLLFLPLVLFGLLPVLIFNNRTLWRLLSTYLLLVSSFRLSGLSLALTAFPLKLLLLTFEKLSVQLLLAEALLTLGLVLLAAVLEVLGELEFEGLALLLL
jgi:hypothetical protein